MKIALQLGLTEEDVQFAQQVGVQDAVWGGPESPTGYLDYDTLRHAVQFFAERGLRLGVIENVSLEQLNLIQQGLPGREEQLRAYCQTITNMGLAGIPVLGYQWMALGGISTDQIRGRGGARERLFDWEAALRAPTAALDWRGPSNPGRTIHLPEREITADEMWENLRWFLERVLPVAEKAGVKLAAHPDDAPIPEFLGVARILSSVEAFQRLVDLAPSPCNGIDFCQGTFSEMPGVDVIAAIRQFGAQGKIHFAHFRDTQGVVPRFTEVFMDEGDTDMYAAMLAYREVGYTGLIRADHTPWVVGDTHNAHRGFGFQVGYMRGLIQAVDAHTRAAQRAGRTIA